MRVLARLGRGAAVVGAWRDRADADPRHGARSAAVLGIALGACFGICFATGIYSHLAQHPPSWFTLPARPAGLYRVTQGVHVLTGIATIPLLLAKLWAVFPRLLRWPPVSSAAHALERISLVPLVGGALFQLWTGVANIDLWYPFPFFFPAAHHAVAWITVGALVVHVGAKAATTREALARHPSDEPEPTADVRARRRFLATAGAGSLLLLATTAGQTVAPLRRLAVLSPRSTTTGPQGFPVNRSAQEAQVVEAAGAPGYRLRVSGAVERPLALSLDDLRTMPQHEATLPIACVEGWSAEARWRGVRLRDVLGAAGATSGSTVVVGSMDGGLYGTSEVNPVQAADPDTLLALEVGGEALHLDHGYPLRLIGPNRPGVMQTKWVDRLEVA